MNMQIVPSALAADYSQLGAQVAALDAAGADRIQWDLMDGSYVPKLTFGADVIAACRPYAACGFEAHVMVDRPEHLLPEIVDAGCELVILHPETLKQPHAAYQQIHALGAKAGVALSPATPLGHVEDVLDLIDMILIMTVNPGFGGQPYLSSMEPKIQRARDLINNTGRPIELQVDGGIGPETITGAAAAGADVFVSGSALWKYDDFAAGITDLRTRATEAYPA